MLWTDAPEISGAVERFNAEQSSWQILLEYHANLTEALSVPGVIADLVVGRSIDQATTLEASASLDFLFERGEISRASFYRDLIEQGSVRGELRLVPLSFDLPVLVYSSQRLPELDPLTLTPSKVRELSAAFQAEGKNSSLTQSFSPLWADFPLTYLHLTGADFSADFQGKLVWNLPGLEAGLKTLSEWTAVEGRGWKTQKEFTTKYLSTSPWPLLTQGRVLFYPATLSEFVTLPLDERRGLDFRYLELDGQVAVTDNVLWGGIRANSASPGAAREFLADLVKPSSQKSLIAWSRSSEFRPFGLLGGLSAVIATNTSDLPGYYPEVDHRIPVAAQLKFWKPLPTNWATLRDKVVVPWLGTDPTPDKVSALQDQLTNFGKPAASTQTTR